MPTRVQNPYKSLTFAVKRLSSGVKIVMNGKISHIIHTKKGYFKRKASLDLDPGRLVVLEAGYTLSLLVTPYTQTPGLLLRSPIPPLKTIRPKLNTQRSSASICVLTEVRRSCSVAMYAASFVQKMGPAVIQSIQFVVTLILEFPGTNLPMCLAVLDFGPMLLRSPRPVRSLYSQALRFLFQHILPQS